MANLLEKDIKVEVDVPSENVDKIWLKERWEILGASTMR